MIRFELRCEALLSASYASPPVIAPSPITAQTVPLPPVRSRARASPSAALIEFTRGVPTLLFIYFFFLAAPQIGITLPSFWKIALPVAISASGVVAEVLRSGVNAVPKGQREAALSLGMQESHAFFRIILPQAMRYIVPSLISELVIVVKDTTFAYVVNFPDLMQDAKVLISNYDALLSVYLTIAVIYILINYALNRLSVFAAAKTGTKPVLTR